MNDKQLQQVIHSTEYKVLLQAVKSRIQSAQIKASIKVNVELLHLYWDLARLIVQKKAESAWGDGFITAISKDLKRYFPGMKGFSPTNLLYMRKWYLFYAEKSFPQAVGESESIESFPQAVGGLPGTHVPQATSIIFQIPWGHNREIITKCKTVKEALFYVQCTIENNWSRAVLVHQIESGLIQRKDNTLNNFTAKLPQPQSDLANQILKDPYCFDFLICKSKNNTVVEYALNNMDSPIGVSEYSITKILPDTLKSSLPSIEAIEAELSGEELK